MDILRSVLGQSPQRGVTTERKMKEKPGTTPLLPSGASRVLRNTETRMTERFIPSNFLAKRVGRGEYGTAYQVHVSERLLAFADSLLSRGSHRVASTKPRLNDYIIVKVSRPNGSNFFMSSVKENTVHKNLSRSPGFPVCSAPIRPEVPKFYLSAFDGENYITMMSMAPGMDAPSFISKYRKTARTYVKFERAIASIWLAGIIHGDLHSGNWLVSSTGDVMILDLGFAVVLPPQLHQQLVQAIVTAVRSGAKTLSVIGSAIGIEDYTNRAMIAQGVKNWRHSDFNAVAREYNRLSPTEKALVPSTRMKYFGCTTQAQVSPRQVSPRQVSPRQASSRQVSSRQVSPRQVSPRQVSLHVPSSFSSAVEAAHVTSFAPTTFETLSEYKDTAKRQQRDMLLVPSKKSPLWKTLSDKKRSIKPASLIKNKSRTLTPKTRILTPKTRTLVPKSRTLAPKSRTQNIKQKEKRFKRVENSAMRPGVIQAKEKLRALNDAIERSKKRNTQVRLVRSVPPRSLSPRPKSRKFQPPSAKRNKTIPLRSKGRLPQTRPLRSKGSLSQTPGPASQTRPLRPQGHPGSWSSSRTRK